MIFFNKSSLEKIRAFSLVEVLVYLAIFLMVSTASVTLMLSLNDFIDQYRLETMLYRSGTSVMEQIMLALRQADSVSASGVGVLTVANTSVVTGVSLTAGVLELTLDGISYSSLTNDNVVVSGFTSYHYDLSPGEMVRVKLDLTATLEDSTTKSITLYGGSVIRGSI